MNGGLRVTAVTIALGLSAAFGLGGSQGVAYADRPPAVDPGLRPPGDPAVPPEKTERPPNSDCKDVVGGTDGPEIPAAMRQLDLQNAWKFSKGEGQVVAVIDTGVVRHPRLPNLRAGGDFVAAGGDGTTEDCDAHGTLVAGIIGASQAPNQGFAGVAPQAQIISIRQQSAMYQKEGRSRDKAPEDLPDRYGDLRTMASAIVRAADMDAKVINISEVWCGTDPNLDGAIGAALQYAVEVKDVVVVTSAGNTDKNGDSCAPLGPVINPLNPTADPWKDYKRIVSPARWDQYVLSVGSINANGAPSEFTVPGPWLSVAAPGEQITSLNPRFDTPDAPDTATGYSQKGQASPINGTSFASPYVAGVVALVRARFPHLSATEVMKRIQATAHSPAEGWNPYIGYGAIDPIAALTNEVVGELPPKLPSPPRQTQLAVPSLPEPPDHRARNIALIGTGAIGGALVLGYLASFPIRRRFGVSSDDL